MSVIAPVFSFDLNGYTGSGLALQDKAEKNLMQITIGIDISKETLDAYRFPDNQHIQVANGTAGHKSLVRWIGSRTGCWSCSRRPAHITVTSKQRLLPMVRHLPRSIRARRAGLPKRPDDWPRLIVSTLSC